MEGMGLHDSDVFQRVVAHPLRRLLDDAWQSRKTQSELMGRLEVFLHGDHLALALESHFTGSTVGQAKNNKGDLPVGGQMHCVHTQSCGVKGFELGKTENASPTLDLLVGIRKDAIHLVFQLPRILHVEEFAQVFNQINVGEKGTFLC